MINWKTILVFVLIFAILGGAYLFIQSYDPASYPTPVTPSPSISLLGLDANLVTQIEIQNDFGGYTFLRSTPGWAVKDAPHIALQTALLETLCFSAANLSAEMEIDTKSASLASYGLDTPQATVSLRTQSDLDAAFMIGDLVPTGDGYYACLAEDSRVYKISAATAAQFTAPLQAFRVMTITALKETDIRSIAITKNGVSLRVQYVAPPKDGVPGVASVWHIESPIRRDADTKLVQTLLLTPLSAVTASDIAADMPDDLSRFGFTGDSVEIQTDTETVRFAVGTKDGASYILPENSDTVYFMGNAPLSFMEVTPFDILEKMTNLISIDTVKSIAVRFPGAEVTLSIDHTDSEMQYFVNDTPADEKPFKSMYIELSALSVDGMVDSAASFENRTPAGTIVYTLTDGSAITLSYYPYDEWNYAISENGECTFFIKKTKLSSLTEKLLAFAKNPQE